MLQAGLTKSETPIKFAPTQAGGDGRTNLSASYRRAARCMNKWLILEEDLSFFLGFQYHRHLIHDEDLV